MPRMPRLIPEELLLLAWRELALSGGVEVLPRVTRFLRRDDRRMPTEPRRILRDTSLNREEGDLPPSGEPFLRKDDRLIPAVEWLLPRRQPAQ